MKIYVEMEGKNPRTGLFDTAYHRITVDDKRIDASLDPINLATQEAEAVIRAVLIAVGRVPA